MTQYGLHFAVKTLNICIYSNKIMIYGEKNMKTKKLKYLPAIAALAITLAIIGFVVTALLFHPTSQTLLPTHQQKIYGVTKF